MIRELRALIDAHRGRTVTVGPIVGRLDGWYGLGDRVALVLDVAGMRVEVGPLAGTTRVEVGAK